ncbi:MAG: TIGR04076 family protein [Acidobacteria bacterium]|nr:TIGR04076 family protein [Acidobacteriota bacterium]NIM64355.1 TIGR04076 family protein [Acidobacteriota bacterium]NIO58528.1 TIGR04076 family protein [Acidobacteriota bacterium]NIQ29582.1 TIGR04076 family protein [Acidobacteriota bacterium]NIQ84278.1 TIGR04076 family protein [Acidobacteriota bacterium]
MAQARDEFTLYDLRVEVAECRGEMVCNHRLGDYFELSGEELSLPPGQSFSIYALAALLPLLPAKQRLTDDADWMTTDTDIACPDPHCGALFRIRRTGKRVFRHDDVTVVPMP